MIKDNTQHQFSFFYQNMNIFSPVFEGLQKPGFTIQIFSDAETVLSRKYADSPLAWVEITLQ